MYVCKDHKGDFFIFVAIRDELSGSSLFRQAVFIPSVLWPSFSASVYLNQYSPAIEGRGRFTTVTALLGKFFRDQQPKAYEAIDLKFIPKHILDIQQKFLPHGQSALLRVLNLC